jgi:peptide/nickel transport system permease protein
MNRLRVAALATLALVFAFSLCAEFVTPASYARQFRESPNAPPSRQFLLGTDELGRDRFSRLVYGTRISLLLAPAAAFISTLIAALAALIAIACGDWMERTTLAVIDLFLALPWFFVLITVRAVLPLNVSPAVSVTITFILLGVLGWATAARVLCASAHSLRKAGFMTQARAAGISRVRMLSRHLLPNLKPLLYAQFWISIPVFILAEANLSLLGLGVAEPLPSWGTMLRELQGYGVIGAQPWRLVPLVFVVAIVSAFQLWNQPKESFR